MARVKQDGMILTNPDGNWAGQAVDVQASLDGGTTWSVVATTTAAGFLVLPDVVLGLVRAVAATLPVSTRINVVFSGWDLRADY